MRYFICVGLISALISIVSSCSSNGTVTASSANTIGTKVFWLNSVQTCIKGLSQNKYVFGGNVLNCETGDAQVDCSGFINALAKTNFPIFYQTLLQRSNRTRPDVSTYFKMLTGEYGVSDSFAQVQKVENLSPGDLILWEYGTEYQQAHDTKASGHIMIVISNPVLLPGLNKAYQLTVADSVLSPHYGDTRALGQTGLGMGTIWIQTNADLAPSGYSWSHVNDWDTGKQIAMGRMIK